MDSLKQNGMNQQIPPQDNFNSIMEHEFKLREFEFRLSGIENKLNWILSLLVTGMIIPIFLHLLRLV